MVSNTSSERASAPMLPPVFIGGTGRSGTTATSKLLDKHSTMARIRFELRIHIVHGGLLDLVAGRGSLAEFTEKMQHQWFYQEGPALATGLHRIIDAKPLRKVLEQFTTRFEADPNAAAGWLIKRLLNPVAAEQGKRIWVEHSPENVINAGSLQALFPRMKLIHSVRDGRDVAASMMRPTRKGEKSSQPVPWGPDSFLAALSWWDKRLREAHAECDRLGPARAFVLRFEDLVETDRDNTYESLLAFLGIDDEPKMRIFFDREITTDKANIGRWQDDVPVEQRDEFEALHADLVDGLRRDGLGLLVTR